MKKIIYFLLAVLLITACEEKKQIDLEAEAEALMATSREWAQSQSNEEYLSYWTEDAQLSQSGYPMMRGHEAIMGMLESTKDIPGFKVMWEPYEAHVSESGDMGYLLENSSFTMNDSLGNPMTQYFRTVTVWKKQDDGKWKCVVDHLAADPQLTSIK
ncbi:YybH family protein [Lentiprolixibacter aurantiacus]|uniref:DUF4440 domain-containing protein n=1 Tax=Lentiprolixibacter aurantiacus TaxID=2993939 RepID=A0AAE3SMG3_9FLAO|nr:DUF4440 domain-containing protein [Lentiprolixibacter aurantiacus]MCX2718677.1 DUF4440 domain-containing protein [Lentiprolixibacter aurantiacus]